MKGTILNVALVVAILGASAIVIHLFARAMYVTCGACGTLNARRRKHCRSCERPLPPGA